MFRTLTLFALALTLLAPAAAQALSATGPFTDAELDALTASTSWVAETRIGDAQINGDWEYDLYPGDQFAEFSQGFAWQPDTPVDFALTFDPAGGDVMFTFGGETLTLNDVDCVDGLAIRLRSESGVMNEVEVEISIAGSPDFDGVSEIAEDGEIVIALFQDLPTPFTMTGSIRMDFDPNDVPDELRGSQLAVQFKGIKVVPVPAAVWLLGAGLAGLAFRRRK